MRTLAPHSLLVAVVAIHHSSLRLLMAAAGAGSGTAQARMGLRAVLVAVVLWVPHQVTRHLVARPRRATLAAQLVTATLAAAACAAVHFLAAAAAAARVQQEHRQLELKQALVEQD